MQQTTDLWIISSGENTKFEMSTDKKASQNVLAKEYKISDLAKYLLNPDAIEVKKTLVGCEIHFRETIGRRLQNMVVKVLPRRCHRRIEEKKMPLQETLVATYDRRSLCLKDKGLEDHLDKIRAAISDFDPLLKRLAHLDTDYISNIIGVCEDAGGNRSLLNLKGTMEEKIKYTQAFLMKKVGVILESANVSEGLFDISGFDFTSFNPFNTHRLIKFYAEGRPRYCVIDAQGEVVFWIHDMNLIHHMHLLDYSIKANPKLSYALGLCTGGQAKPLRLLFKRHLDIDYTRSPLPSLYRDLFDTYKVGSAEKDDVLKSLKNAQLGILFNYVPNSDTGRKKLYTAISVMHDVRALAPIKNHLPNLYSVVDKMASVSEAGKYYLLDYMKGSSNDQRL